MCLNECDSLPTYCCSFISVFYTCRKIHHIPLLIVQFSDDVLIASSESVKTSPSLADAAMGRIAQGTKVLAEGGYEKVFQQTFETVPEEKLFKSYACYLSTSAGPVMGVLYLSTAKLAFCSDNPLSYKVGDRTEYSYYKVHLSFFPNTSGHTSW